MPKHFDPRDKTRSRSESIQERQAQALAAKQVKLTQYQDAIAKRAEKTHAGSDQKNATPVRDTVAYGKALGEIPFIQLGRADILHPSATYLRLVDIALRNMSGGTREAVLCWPNCEPSPAAIAALLALADCGAAAPTKCDGMDALTPPFGLRALIYPYARTAHRALRHIYVDKGYLGRLQLKHQIRCNHLHEDSALSDYHKTLARVRTLTGIALDRKEYPEFRNPCLDELIPSGPCHGSEARSELLWRVRTKTDLSKISRSNQADDPAKARFYLFGLRAGEPLSQSLKRITGLHIVFLDLNGAGRNRLGNDWLLHIRELLATLEAKFGSVATVALTEDPWTYDALRFDGLITGPRRKSSRTPAPSSVVLAQHPEIFVSANPPLEAYAVVKEQEIIAFAGEVELILGQLRAARRSAADLHDSENVERLRSLIGIIRRGASLPGSRNSFAEFLEQELVGSAAAADILAAFRVGTLISNLQQSNGPWAQTARAELLKLCQKVEKASGNTETSTPMAVLLLDVLREFLRVSSRTAVMFQKDMLADFAAYALVKDTDIGGSIKNRLENRMLLFLDRAGLDDLQALSSSERNYIKTLIVVAPTRSTLLSLLARPWLPDKVIVLADSDALASAARDATRLSKYKELAPLRQRMEGFAARAGDAVQRVTNSSVDLDQSLEPSDDIDMPISGIVNLAGKVRADQTVFRFEFDGSQIVLARPGTALIVQDKSQTIPLFTEVEARNVEIGDHVCVIGDAFLEMARPLLNIIARAAEEIRDYHELVLERLESIPGSSVSERLACVVETMALPDVTAQRARYWVDIRHQLEVPLHEVVSHAPVDLNTFLAFMKALSISESIARRYWTWAVIAQRTSRMRAAINFHDAYRGILVDSPAAQSDNPDRVRDIRRLRAAAENFVAVVRAKQEQRGNRAGV